MQNIIEVIISFVIILFLTTLDFSFVDIVIVFNLMLFVYDFTLTFYRKNISRYASKYKNQLVLTLFLLSYILILMTIFYIDEINDIKGAVKIISLYLPFIFICAFITPNKYRFVKFYNKYYYIMYFIIGYYFYYRIPNDIIRETNIGVHLYSEFYLIIISFTYLTILLCIILSFLLPFFVAGYYFFMKLHLDIKYNKKLNYRFNGWIKKLVMLNVFFIITNIFIFMENTRKIDTDNFIKNSIVYFYYTEKPEKCDYKPYHYDKGDGDKFMFIDINNISIAYKLASSYYFEIEKCQDNFK